MNTDGGSEGAQVVNVYTNHSPSPILTARQHQTQTFEKGSMSTSSVLNQTDVIRENNYSLPQKEPSSNHFDDYQQTSMSKFTPIMPAPSYADFFVSAVAQQKLTSVSGVGCEEKKRTCSFVASCSCGKDNHIEKRRVTCGKSGRLRQDGVGKGTVGVRKIEEFCNGTVLKLLSFMKRCGYEEKWVQKKLWLRSWQV